MNTNRLATFAATLLFIAASYSAELVLTKTDPLPVVWLDFLRTQNLSNLVQNLAPAVEDYEAEARRFGRTLSSEQRGEIEKACASYSRNLTGGGEELLKIGKRFGIVSSTARWAFKNATADSPRQSTDPRVHQKGETQPTVPFIRLHFVRKDPATAALDGEYAVDLLFAEQFPTGWHVVNGLRWSAFPHGVVSPALHADMQLASKFPLHGSELTLSGDRALNELSKRFTTFLAKMDPDYFAHEMLYSTDVILSLLRERDPDRDLPPKNEMDNAIRSFHEKAMDSARSVLAQAETLGLDLSKATVTAVRAEDATPNYSSGLLDMFRAQELFFTLNIPRLDGKLVSGDSVLGSAPAERVAGKWYLHELRWVSLPDGLATPEESARLEFENYVAKFRRLPPDTAAPDIQMLPFDDAAPVSLASHRGRYVVLEWWATWCGPCQQPMAELQKKREVHPGWSDKVELITVSIDDKLEDARKHLLSRGWTNTVNFWAGGGWDSAPAKAFRVSAIPTVYLISPEGKIIGPPGAWEHELDSLLKSATK